MVQGKKIKVFHLQLNQKPKTLFFQLISTVWMISAVFQVRQLKKAIIPKVWSKVHLPLETIATHLPKLNPETKDNQVKLQTFTAISKTKKSSQRCQRNKNPKIALIWFEYKYYNSNMSNIKYFGFAKASSSVPVYGR